MAWHRVLELIPEPSCPDVNAPISQRPEDVSGSGGFANAISSSNSLPSITLYAYDKAIRLQLWIFLDVPDALTSTGDTLERDLASALEGQSSGGPFKTGRGMFAKYGHRIMNVPYVVH